MGLEDLGEFADKSGLSLTEAIIWLVDYALANAADIDELAAAARATPPSWTLWDNPRASMPAARLQMCRMAIREIIAGPLAARGVIIIDDPWLVDGVIVDDPIPSAMDGFREALRPQMCIPCPDFTAGFEADSVDRKPKKKALGYPKPPHRIASSRGQS